MRQGTLLPRWAAWLLLALYAPALGILWWITVGALVEVPIIGVVCLPFAIFGLVLAKEMWDEARGPR